MRLNSKLRFFWYALRTDPIVLPWLLGYAILLLFSVRYPYSGIPIFLILLWMLWFLSVEFTAAHGWCLPPMKKITPNFYIVQGLCFHGIFQCRAWTKSPLSCRAAVKNLFMEQKQLPAALLPGRYRAITHETILNRLEMLDNLKNVKVVYIGEQSLERVVRQMMGGRCRHCHQPCPIQLARTKKRPFYYVQFTIKK